MIIRFEEFRFTPMSFIPTSKRRLNVMIDRIARAYQGVVGRNIGLENTNVLLVYIYNSDDESLANEKVGYALASSKDYIGAFRFFMSEKKLLSGDDFEKRLYVLEEFHIAWTNFLKNFGYNEEAELFEKGKNKFINELDFWGRYTKGYISRNKKYECWLESRQCWGFTEYRIGFKNLATEEISLHFIGNMPYPFFDEMTNITPENHFDIVLNTPHTFTDIKWVKNTFELFWGKDKYIFDTEKEEVRKVS